VARSQEDGISICAKEKEREMIQVITTKSKYCAFCLVKGIMQRATFEGRTEDGDWAYMCFKHYAQHGVGLGIGKGRRINGKS